MYHSLGSMNWFENCTTVQKGLRLTGGGLPKKPINTMECDLGVKFRGAQSQKA